MELLFYLTIPGTSVLYSYAEVVCMKISEIIARVDDLKPNGYSFTTKLGWINHVDGMVWNEIYKYTGFTNIARQAGVSAYDLPVGVDFNLVTNVYVDGKEIYLISHRDFETTGYYRGVDGKLNIYPTPTENDAAPGLRVAYRLPFVPHTNAEEEAYIPAPYDKAYDDYIAAMIDKYNREYDEYNNNMNFYNNSIKEYAVWYNNHKEG